MTPAVAAAVKLAAFEMIDQKQDGVITRSEFESVMRPQTTMVPTMATHAPQL